jgi:hypothetical protein
MNSIETALSKLINTVASHEAIRAIGASGGDRPYPEPGEGDIDLFVYCTEIPSKSQRQALLMPLGDEIGQVEIGRLESGHFGQGDCVMVAGVETWLLYFTLADARAELELILDGQSLDRLDNYYYPIGRLAMWKTMRVLYDPDGFLQSFKHRLAEYPQKLASAVVSHHLEALADVEDLERAVGRKDVLFFHFALDLALDHFLQAVFALNREYFPSRKRSELYLQGFKVKPLECEERLRQVLALGGNAETLNQSYEIWNSLVHDLKGLGNGIKNT